MVPGGADVLALLRGITQASVDVRNLLSVLDAHQENAEEYLEPDDFAVVEEIRRRYAIDAAREGE